MSLAPILLLLHGSGLDELIMVGVGLALAFAIISLTGRRRPDRAQDEQEPAADERPDRVG